MANFKDFVKNGWHPEKEGTTLRGQVSSLMGRNKDSSASSSRADHVSRPLSDLKDPSAFAPPPRRTASGLDSSPPDGRSPASYSAPAAAAATKPAPPRLPPRLPPRGARDSPPPPFAGSSRSSDRHLNQGAVDRLGAAGVSVPGFGIGRSGATASNTSPPLPGPAVAAANGFSKLGTPSSAPSATPPPNQGTTWAQKQAALKTASAFHKNPSSVSLADAKTAASTANNFRQRHGDQVEAGIKRTNHLNQKYGVTNKVGAFVNREHQGQAGQATVGDSGLPAMGPGLPVKKKPPPPPPPKKKPGFGEQTRPAAGGNDEAPPPIPMSTRPAF
ncbi:GMP synthase [Ophiocordyceps sinensis CO18]|uniref:GMP synthase n=1 Tax=Ophiocordyceps sinensis (strain Co18 / CGMCC 3.14243) TaxID=911162 RepID=T5AHL0_OPHSC|nr:GMP synthase [Ophiocordyceps sinensis CO18]